MSQLHSLAAPYALNALGKDDRRRFEEHLVRCEPCRLETSEYVATAARLAGATARPPPEDLRRRVLLAAQTTPQRRHRAIQPSSRSTVRSSLPRVAVAVVLVLGMTAAGGYVVERSRARDSQVVSTSLASVLAAPDASTKAEGLRAGGNVRLVSSATRDVAVIAANDLSRPPRGSVYEVWMISGDTAVPHGTFVTGGTVILREIASADRVTITVEPRAGARRPSSPAVVTFAI